MTQMEWVAREHGFASAEDLEDEIARLEAEQDREEGRCRHGMFFSGAGACPMCEGSEEPPLGC